MKKKPAKLYGRKNINKLDWILAIVCCIIGAAALWISIGISIANAGAATAPAFADVAHGLLFWYKSEVGTVGVQVANTVIFYLALIYLVFGIVHLSKKQEKDRIPGVVATFVAAVGIIFFLSLVCEFTCGLAKGSIKGFWAYSSIAFLVALCVFAVLAALATWCKKYDIELKKSSPAEEKPEEQPKVEEKEEVKEEPEEIVVEEEPAPEEPYEEVRGEPVEGNFKGLNGRRRRIPFENKLKRSVPEVREHYKEIAHVIAEYKVNDRKSIPGETVSYKREKLVFITFSGKTLKVHFALDPKEFENSPLPIKDASDVKKYEQTPAYMRVKSGLAVRRSIDLIRRIMTEHKVPRK